MGLLPRGAGECQGLSGGPGFPWNDTRSQGAALADGQLASSNRWRACQRSGPHREPAPAGNELAGLALEPAALAFGEPAPDAEPLVVLQRVLKALGPHLAASAHPLGLPGGPALLGKERLRIRLRAQRLVLPGGLDGVVRADAKRLVH